jgi:hypothetical protein
MSIEVPNLISVSVQLRKTFQKYTVFGVPPNVNGHAFSVGGFGQFFQKKRTGGTK